MKLRYAHAGLLILVTLQLAACGGEDATFELSGRTMGTRFSVQIVLPPEQMQESRLQQGIDAVLETVQQQMSTYRVQSELSGINANRSTDWTTVSKALCEAIEESVAISKLTGGAFDITVGPLVNLWGFGPDEVRIEPPAEADVAAARERIGYRQLHTDCSLPALRKDRPDVYIDLSAYAKGLAVDRIGDFLEQEDVGNYLVEIGGELRMRGQNARGELWGVAIEMPSDADRSVRHVYRLTDAAVATSGDYRNFFEYAGQRYSHTIDARNGRPVSHELASVTVVAERAAFADAMATALLVLGPVQGMALARRERLAAYFQLRTDQGFAERFSPAFEAIAAGSR